MELDDEEYCYNPNDSLNGCCDSSNLSKQVFEIVVFHREFFLNEVLNQLGHKWVAHCLFEHVVDLAYFRWSGFQSRIVVILLQQVLMDLVLFGLKRYTEDSDGYILAGVGYMSRVSIQIDQWHLVNT